ncbi:hypothetical protein ACLOJK_040625, partial [Asimina triloba]
MTCLGQIAGVSGALHAGGVSEDRHERSFVGGHRLEAEARWCSGRQWHGGQQRRGDAAEGSTGDERSGSGGRRSMQE